MKFTKPQTIKKLILLGLTIFFCNFLTAQVDETKNSSAFWEHVRFGGGLGLSTTGDFFSFFIAPSAIYEFNPQFALGTSLNYSYNRFKNRYKSHIYGGSVLGLFHPIEELQLSVEFEELLVNKKYEGIFRDSPSENYWSPALFVGAGYRTNNVTFGVRYDLLFNRNRSVYADAIMPFVRVYF